MPVPTTDEILHKRQVYQTYHSEPHNRYSTMSDAYHGNFQKLWPGEFRRGEAPKVANWIKLGWDRYSKMVGKLPTNHVKQFGLKRRKKSKADKIEKILAFYDEASGMSGLMKWLSWYLIGFGSSCIGVLPDPVLKGPRFFIKDPRAVLAAPGSGSISTTPAQFGMMSKPTMSVVSLSDVLFNETVTASFVKDQFRHIPDDVERCLEGDNLSTPQEMITYLDRDCWVILVNGERLIEVEHGLDFVPVRCPTMHVPDQLGGQSMFEQNIGLVLAYMRVLNQKLTYNHNVVWPWLVTRGLTNMDPNRRVIELMERDGMAEFLSPPAELQTERDLDVLDRLIRVMNHDTEAMQGQAPGSIVTGRSIVELNRDVRTQVSDFWEVLKPDLEFIKSSALIIDEEMYGGVKKSIHGKVKGEPFEDSYVPKRAISGNHAVEIDFGIGVGGFEGFAELMQFAAQGFVDEQTVMEHAPWVRSVSETRRKVLLDRIEKLLLEQVAGGAPAMLTNHLSSWHKAIEGNDDPWEWLVKNPFPEPEPEPAPGGPPAPAGPPQTGPLPPGGGSPGPPTPSPADILQSMMAPGAR